MTQQQWTDTEIGPRQVGGRYRSGYYGMRYEVLAVHRNVPVWGWAMTVRWADGRTTSHSTAWRNGQDEVISQPPAA